MPLIFDIDNHVHWMADPLLNSSERLTFYGFDDRVPAWRPRAWAYLYLGDIVGMKPSYVARDSIFSFKTAWIRSQSPSFSEETAYGLELLRTPIHNMSLIRQRHLASLLSIMDHNEQRTLITALRTSYRTSHQTHYDTIMHYVDEFEDTGDDKSSQRAKEIADSIRSMTRPNTSPTQDNH